MAWVFGYLAASAMLFCWMLSVQVASMGEQNDSLQRRIEELRHDHWFESRNE